MGFRSAIGLVLALAATASAQTPPPAGADAVARDLQKKYDRISDFSADFVHSYRGGVLKQQATERGRLLVKKPGKMRWEYTSPEKKIFVSDGHTLYSYIPQDKQVIVSTVPPQDQATTPAMFLTGKGDIIRDYQVAFDKVAEAPSGSIALRLTPRRREAEYDWLTLVVQPGSLRLLMLITVDTQGGRSAFTFSNLKENVGLADKEFVFQMPRNVDVVRDGGTR
jgi:outer membrane lipoprotein carrier protein